MNNEQISNAPTGKTMTRTISILEAIAQLLFGKKYYAIAIYRIGETEIFLTGEIFRTKQEAEQRKNAIINNTISFRYVTTVSFRSRQQL